VREARVLEHYRQPALIETYIEGREIYVSVLDQENRGPQAFPFYEIDFSEMPADRPRIVSFEGKWVEGSVDYSARSRFRALLWPPRFPPG